MNSGDLKSRTKKFGVNVINLVKDFPEKRAYWIIGDQLLRSATSVGANYRAACRAKSKADFAYKINIVLEEADESLFWFELIVESDLCTIQKIKPLIVEANELTAIFAKSLMTIKGHQSIRG